MMCACMLVRMHACTEGWREKLVASLSDVLAAQAIGDAKRSISVVPSDAVTRAEQSKARVFLDGVPSMLLDTQPDVYED